MKIVSMTQSTRVADRWYIELENGEKLKVNLAMIADHSLFTGRELDNDELETVKSESDKAALKSSALRSLGARMMSGRELYDKLRMKGAEERDAAETVAWAEKLGYINDREYAGMVVRHYAAKGYGRRKISDELYRRGIDRALRDEALENMPDTYGEIEKLIEKKLGGRTPDKKELKKLSDMLLRRGFSWEEISDALRAVNNEE